MPCGVVAPGGVVYVYFGHTNLLFFAFLLISIIGLGLAAFSTFRYDIPELSFHVPRDGR